MNAMSIAACSDGELGKRFADFLIGKELPSDSEMQRVRFRHRPIRAFGANESCAVRPYSLAMACCAVSCLDEQFCAGTLSGRRANGNC